MAAGVGINLQISSNVVLAELSWTDAEQTQAIDRVHRIGQAEPVTAWRIIASQTIDTKIAELIDSKAGIAGPGARRLRRRGRLVGRHPARGPGRAAHRGARGARAARASADLLAQDLLAQDLLAQDLLAQDLDDHVDADGVEADDHDGRDARTHGHGPQLTDRAGDPQAAGAVGLGRDPQVAVATAALEPFDQGRAGAHERCLGGPVDVQVHSGPTTARRGGHSTGPMLWTTPSSRMPAGG